MPGQSREAGCVSARRLRAADDAFVASHLTLAAQAALHPGERRVKREQNQEKLLDEIGPVVVPAQVLSFVHNHLAELLRSEAGIKPIGNKNARRKKSNDAGPVEFACNTDLHAAARA